ncbi:MAG: hypothetical protein LBF90_05475 [Prevotellaceae bacterium]|jgi:hypothetical protein|nr:hypothetical protein [Prevotellaceae bacterium]
MKTVTLIFFFFLLLASCKKSNPEPDDNLITDIGMIIINPDYPVGTCGEHLFSVEKNEKTVFYVPDSLPDEFKTHNLPVVVTYELTDEQRMCGFSGKLFIITIKKMVKR